MSKKVAKTSKAVKKKAKPAAKAAGRGGRGRGREARALLQARADRLFDGLMQLYPEAHCELVHRNPFELLVATILSAQCTDVRVNMVTPKLFERFPTAEAMAKADVRELEDLVRTTGFFRNKAKNIKAASELIVSSHGGDVPRSMEQLLLLPGVARKTANVVLGNAYGINVGVVVDTHVARLSQRLGLTAATDPKKIEQDLMQLFPREQWTLLSHLLIWHGRRVCAARKPDCDHCTLRQDCPQIGVTSSR